MLVGLVLDRDGFPKDHEVFEGNLRDRSTVKEMLESLEKRTGQKLRVTMVIDCVAYEENLAEIRVRGYHYAVASRQPERNIWLAEFDNEDDPCSSTLVHGHKSGPCVGGVES